MWLQSTVRTQEHLAGLIKSLFFIRRIYSCTVHISNFLISNPFSHSMNFVTYFKGTFLWTSWKKFSSRTICITIPDQSVAYLLICKCKMYPPWNYYGHWTVLGAWDLVYLHKTQQVIVRQSKKFGPFSSLGLLNRDDLFLQNERTKHKYLIPMTCKHCIVFLLVRIILLLTVLFAI